MLRPFVDDLGESLRIDRFCCDDDVDGLPQPFDFAVRGFQMTEELLFDVFARNTGLVVDLIFGERLLRGLDVDLDILEGESWVERAVEEA